MLVPEQWYDLDTKPMQVYEYRCCLVTNIVTILQCHTDAELLQYYHFVFY